MGSLKKVESYQFPKSPLLFYFKGLYKDRGHKAFYQFLSRPHWRPWIRFLIRKYAPKGYGLEIGVGARTVAPVDRTILSDAFEDHGVDASIAKVFFKADAIPYPDKTFHFILSEHMLEHATDPIRILKEWSRVLKPGGKIFLNLPHRDRGNDRYRERTTLKHLIEDHENQVPDDDQTHLPDWMENVVGRGLLPDHYAHMKPEEWISTGSIHHHVWVTEDIVELFEYLNFKICYTTDKLYDRRDSFLVIAEKS